MTLAIVASTALNQSFVAIKPKHVIVIFHSSAPLTYLGRLIAADQIDGDFALNGEIADDDSITHPATPDLS